MTHFVSGILPSFFLTGPLALLALLFPALFGGLSLWLRRWLALLSALSVLSLVYLAHVWLLRPYVLETWWSQRVALWWSMAVVTALGIWWAWLRRRRVKSSNQGKAPQGELVGLALLEIAFVLMALTVPKPSARLAWIFEAPERGAIVSSPLVVGDRLVVAATLERGLNSIGTLYCLDRTTGKKIWSFDDGGSLKPIFSSPCCYERKIYFGEGFHQDSDCRLLCVEIETGKMIWQFQTHSHVESSPLALAGRVFVGAGDDGVYCLHADSGQMLWQCREGHVDSSPASFDSRVYFGCNSGDRHEVICVDSYHGKVLWRTRCPYPVWGSPSILDSPLYVGIGRGNYLQSDPAPAGALLSLDPERGDICWQFDADDTVLARPNIGWISDVCFTSRDGFCYYVNRATAKLLWKKSIGSPIVAAPVPISRSLIVAATGGQLVALTRDQGVLRWKIDVGASFQARAEIIATPAAFEQGDERSIYCAATMHNPINSAAVVMCFKDD